MVCPLVLMVLFSLLLYEFRMEAPLQSAFLDLLVCGEGELDKVQTLQPLPYWNLVQVQSQKSNWEKR